MINKLKIVSECIVEENTFVNADGIDMINVHISYADNSSEIIAYKYLDQNYIDTKLNRGELLTLDGCYVKGLSITDRDDINIPSASNAFFDGGNDLYQTVFKLMSCNFKQDQHISFNKTIFNKGSVNIGLNKYSNASFFDLSGTIFITCSVMISDCSFQNTALCLSDVRFYNSSLTITHCKLNGYNYPLSINYSDFNNSKITVTENNIESVLIQRLFIPNGSLIFSDNNINKLDINNVLCKYITFTNTRFTENLYIRNILFLCLNFDDCIIEKYLEIDISSRINTLLLSKDINGERYIAPEDWSKKSISFINTINFGLIKFNEFFSFDMIKNQKRFKKDIRHMQMADQYRMLKENYKKLEDADFEDNSNVEYRRYKRKSPAQNYITQSKQNIEYFINNKLATKPRSLKDLVKILLVLLYGIELIGIYLKNFFEWLLMDIIGGKYATKPLRILFEIIMSIITFGMIYYLLSITKASAFIISEGLTFSANILGNVVGNRFFSALYFSAITFFTIGYGDVAPAINIIRFLASCEGFLGLVLISLFTVSTFRKIFR